jgi:hypothetical protein
MFLKDELQKNIDGSGRRLLQGKGVRKATKPQSGLTVC